MARDYSETAKNAVVETAETVEAKALQTTVSAGKKIQSANEYVMDAAKPIDKLLRTSLKDQPIATLAVAAGVGFTLGAIWWR
jgi:ElaB/YqjD/DUF883 family membrane-anchored ribosome-binding protein